MEKIALAYLVSNNSRIMASVARGQWACLHDMRVNMHDMRVNGLAISRFDPCGCTASFCYLELLHAWRRLRWPIW